MIVRMFERLVRLTVECWPKMVDESIIIYDCTIEIGASLIGVSIFPRALPLGIPQNMHVEASWRLTSGCGSEQSLAHTSSRLLPQMGTLKVTTCASWKIKRNKFL